jgi:Uri superfamily endonuclease
MARVKTLNLPAEPGTYVLHLSVSSPCTPGIGRLGCQHFPAGHYFYVGSALGAGGLRARVGRHLRGAGAQHWHIDYLRAVTEVREVLYTVTDSPLECAWGQALAQLPGAFVPVLHFGATDCRSGCAAHLIGFPRHAHITGVPRALAAITPTPIGSLRPTGSLIR